MTFRRRPAGYMAYVLVAKEHGENPDAKLAQCNARYRFARNRETVILNGLSEQSQHAYTSALRVPLAIPASNL